MILLRLLLLAAALWLIWRIVRQVRAQLRRPAEPPVPGDDYEPMARCQRCGTYLPARSLSPTGHCGRCAG